VGREFDEAAEALEHICKRLGVHDEGCEIVVQSYDFMSMLSIWQKNADQTGGIQSLPPPQSIKDADATRMQLLELNQDLIGSVEYYVKAVQDLRNWTEYIATLSLGIPSALNIELP
jgi:hypothetical protein